MPSLTINNRPLHVSTLPPAATSSSSSSSPPKTIIFIHGLGSSENFYQPILPRFKQHFLITFDLYGSSRSPLLAAAAKKDVVDAAAAAAAADDDVQTIESMAEDVVGILDALGVGGKVVLVGHSMGGIVANWIAAGGSGEVWRGRVEGVVLLGPVNPNPATAEIIRKRVEVVRDEGIEPLLSQIPFTATGTNSTPLHRAFIREFLHSQSPTGYISQCSAIITASVPNYAAIKAPVIIIAGKDDRSAPMEGCEVIFGTLGGRRKEMVVLEGVGHWVVVEAHEEVGRLVEGFLEKLGLPGCGPEVDN